MAEKPPVLARDEYSPLEQGVEQVVTKRRRKLMGVFAVGALTASAAVVGVGVGIAGKVVEGVHAMMPTQETSAEESYGTVVEMVAASPVCPVAYAVDAGAKVTAINKVLNLPTGSRSAVIERVRVNSELCQDAASIEKVYDMDEGHMTFNVPIDEFYVKSGVDFAAKEDGKDVLSMEMQGEGLEFLAQLTRSFTENVGIIRDTGLGKGLSDRESELTALAMLESQRVASKVCGPDVIARGLDLYKEGLIEVVEVGAPEGTTFDVNFVKNNGEPALNDDGSVNLENGLPWRDVFGDEVVDVKAELEKSKTAHKDGLEVSSDERAVECAFDENIATDTVKLATAPATAVQEGHPNVR